MARHIKYPAPCYYCSKVCQPKEGFLQRVKGGWFAHCLTCYQNKKEQEKREKELEEDIKKYIGD